MTNSGYMSMALSIMMGTLVSLTCYSQLPGKVDSLYGEYNRSFDDTSRLALLIEIAHEWIDYNLDSTIAVSRRVSEKNTKHLSSWNREAMQVEMIAHYYRNEIPECISLIRRMMKLIDKENLKLLGAAYNNLGLMYSTSNRYDSATICFDSSFHYYRMMPEPFAKGISDALSNRATMEIENHSPDKALSSYLEALEFLDKSKNPSDVASVYNNIGSLYNRTSQFTKALYYLEESLRLKMQEKMFSSAANTLALLGNTYMEIGSFSRSDSCFAEALRLEQQMGNLAQQGSTLSAMASLYLRQNLSEKALETARRSEAIKRIHSNEGDYANVRYQIGLIFNRLEEYDSARFHLQFATEKLRELGHHLDLMQALLELAITEEYSNNYKSAYQHLKEAYDIREKVLGEENRRTLAELENKYQTRLKDEQIESMSLQAELDSSAIQRHRLWISLLSFGGLLLVMLFVVLWQWGKYKRKKLLDHQKRLVQEQENLALRSVIDGEERERTRIARELHDGLNGSLAAIRMRMSSIMALNDQRETTTNYQIIEMLDGASQEVRRIAHNMMPEILLKFGILEAISEFIGSIGSHQKLKCEFIHNGIDLNLSQQEELMLYRIVQELVTNVIRHSDADEVLVQLDASKEMITLTVEDNGKGFHEDKSETGMGLENIKTRLSYLNGQIQISSSAQSGTSVYIYIPKRDKEK